MALIVAVCAVPAATACAPASTAERGVVRPITVGSTPTLAAADARQVHSSHLRPVAVLFGNDVVRVADGSGGYVDVTPVHTSNEYVYDAYFVDRDHGWVGFNDPAAATGRLVRTDDGGRTWEATNLTARVHQSAGSRGWIRFLDRDVGWVVTTAASAPAGGIHRTTDGGRTWSDWTDEPEPGPSAFRAPTTAGSPPITPPAPPACTNHRRRKHNGTGARFRHPKGTPRTTSPTGSRSSKGRAASFR